MVDIYARGASQARVEAELDKIGGVRYHYAIAGLVSGLILQAASMLGYILAEGLADAAQVKEYVMIPLPG